MDKINLNQISPSYMTLQHYNVSNPNENQISWIIRNIKYWSVVQEPKSLFNLCVEEDPPNFKFWVFVVMQNSNPFKDVGKIKSKLNLKSSKDVRAVSPS